MDLDALIKPRLSFVDFVLTATPAQGVCAHDGVEAIDNRGADAGGDAALICRSWQSYCLMTLIIVTAIGLDVSITTLAVGHTNVDVFNLACLMASSDNVPVSVFCGTRPLTCCRRRCGMTFSANWTRLVFALVFLTIVLAVIIEQLVGLSRRWQ